MRRSHLVYIFICGLFISVLGFGQTHESTQTPSLGELARQLKAQRAKSRPAARVFTNDNLLARPPEENLTPAAGTSEAPGGQKEAAKAEREQGAGAASSAKPSEGAHDEKYFRARMKDLQDTLDLHRRELAVLQQKLGQNQMQYYPDPNKTLMQQYSRADIKKLNDDIDKKQQQIADDEKAIDDLRDQLRREGGDPAWLR